MKVPVSPSSPFPTEQGWSRYILACSEAALLCRKIKVAHYKKKRSLLSNQALCFRYTALANTFIQWFLFCWFSIVTVFFFFYDIRSVRLQQNRVATCQPPTVSRFDFHFHPCFAGLSCRPSARARGTWSTVHFATERCPCLSSSPWWTAPCSSALRGTTRSSMTFRVTCKVRLALAFHQNLLTVIRSS